MGSVQKRAVKGVIRIIFAKNPPDAFTTCNSFPVLIPSMDCPFPGWLVEVVKMLADYLSFQIDPIIIQSDIGNDSGNWTGILGILQQGMADTVCTLYPFTEQKARFFNFSHPVTSVRDLYIAKPKRKSISLVLWNAFLPYEPKLWMLLFLSLVIQCGLASLVCNIEYRLNLRSTYSPLEATLFTQLYTAVLLSALIRGQNPNPWDSYKEMVHLVRDGTYSLVMDKHHLHKDNSFYETLSYYTNLSQLRNLADAIKSNPIIVVENDDNNQIPTFFLFSRHSKLLREWNRAIQNNQAFIRRTYEKYFFNSFNTGNVPRCKRTAADDKLEWYGGSSNAARDASLSLDIVSTFGIFLIVLIGFTIALLAFVCELLVDAKARRFHRKWHIRHALVFTASNPTHLMAIARLMHHKRKRMAHIDSQTSTETPPAFFREEKQKAKKMAAEAVKETTKSARQQAESTKRMPNGGKTAEELKNKTNERVEVKQNETEIGADKFKKLSINGTMGTTSPTSFLTVETVTYGVETAATNSTSLSGGGGGRELDPMVDDVFALLAGSDDNTTTSNGVVEVEEEEEGEEAESFRRSIASQPDCHLLIGFVDHLHKFPTNTLITKLRGTTMDGKGAVVRLVCANEMEQFIGREENANERKKTSGDEETFLKTVVVAEKTWLPGCIAVFFDSRTLDQQLDNMAKLLWKGGEPKFGTTDGNNKWAASKFFCGEKERDLFFRELYKMKARNEKVFNGVLIIGAEESEKRNVLLKKLDEELYCAEETKERGFFQRLWNGLFG
uniref:Lig_chan-Glu_bd domain-containing protein n=1 Tax=Globodera pallida TaxID=36090 RepID=A0A183BVR5_GLOPA